MLEKTEWVEINKGCYALVDEDRRVISTVYTSYSPDDGDTEQIWEADIEDEVVGSFVGMWAAKYMVHKLLLEWESAEEAKKKKRSATTAKKKTTEKVKKV